MVLVSAPSAGRLLRTSHPGSIIFQTCKLSQRYPVSVKKTVKAGSELYIWSAGRPINHSDASSLLLESILGGRDAILIDEDGEGHALLDWAATCLAGLRVRILRAAEVLPDTHRTPMPSLHVAGPPLPSIPDDDFLIQSYNALTVLDQTCDRIVLLVDDGHPLQRSTLRYIQFVSRSGAPLQLVFCGTRKFHDLLEIEEFCWLRARLMFSLVVTLATPVVQVSTALPRVPFIPLTPEASVGKTATSRLGTRRPTFIASMSSRSLRLASLALFGIGGAAWLTLCMQEHGTIEPTTSTQASLQPTTLKPPTMAAPETQVFSELTSRAIPDTGPAALDSRVIHLPAATDDVRDAGAASPSSMPLTPPSTGPSRSLVAVLPQTKAGMAQPNSMESPSPSPPSNPGGQRSSSLSHIVDPAATHLLTNLEPEVLSAPTQQVLDIPASHLDSKPSLAATASGLHLPSSMDNVRGTNQRPASSIPVVPSYATTPGTLLTVLPSTKTGVPQSEPLWLRRLKSVPASDVGRYKTPSVLSRIAAEAPGSEARRLKLSRKQAVPLRADDQWLVPQPASDSGDGAQRYIGSYATDANGVRMFHSEP